MSDAVLRIENLSVSFETERGPLRALRDVSLAVPKGEIMGIVGESGCGKSTLINAILRLLAGNGRIERGRIFLEGQDLVPMSQDQMRQVRGQRVSVVFQDPLTALNPVLTIGRQLCDVLYRTGLSGAEKKKRAIEMLERVSIPDPARRLTQYPGEFSGGMRQRIAIAMALLTRPALLIADEPTTALDATLEVQIIDLLKELQKDLGCTILFISHHLGVIAELCDQVAVMYAGEVVERGSVRDLFHHPRHPYSRKLLECDPARIAERSRHLPTISGDFPDLTRLPQGCIFASRCPDAHERCRIVPESHAVSATQSASCHLLAERAPA